MKIALVFSGQIRCLHKTKKFWLNFINRHNADVYASFWDDENYKLDDTVDNFLSLYNPKKIEIESHNAFEETTTNILKLYVNAPNTYTPQLRDSIFQFNIAPMLYKIWKGNTLTAYSNKKYDVVIRARTDVLFDTNINIVSNNMLNVPVGLTVGAFQGDIGINDCFGYGTPTIMNYYSCLFLKIMEYLDNGHHIFPPEHLLLTHLSKVNMKIRFFPNYMGIAREKTDAIQWYNEFVGTDNMIESIVDTNTLNVIPNTNSEFKVDNIKNKLNL